ncbi:MAG: hypothetical protein Q8P07_04805 [bacterium]|nr:hypothetical protein [bacterium]
MEEEDKKENSTNGKMTVMRSILLIAVAFGYDCLQIVVSFAATGISGLAQLPNIIPVIGTFIATFIGAPIGAVAFGVGAMINLILSIYAFLTFFILLKLWGYKVWKVFFWLAVAFILEEVPLGNNFLFWTGWAAWHVIEDYKKQGKKVLGGKTLGKLIPTSVKA